MTTAERDYEAMWRMAEIGFIRAIERHHELALGVIRLASEGKWEELVDLAGDSLNNVDAVEPEDIPVFEEAKRRAASAGGTET